MWKLSIIVREVWHNLYADGWRTLLVLLAAAALLYSVSATELRTARDALRTVDALTASGEHVYVVESPPADVGSQTGVDATRCVALEHQVHVLAVGGFQLAEAAVLDRAPGASLEFVRTVGRMGRLWDAGYEGVDAEVSVLVPTGVSSEIGIAGGQPLRVNGQTFANVDLFDPTDRFPTATVWIAVKASPEGRVDQCWVEFRAGQAVPGSDALRAWFEDAGAHVSLRPLLVGGDFKRDPAREFNERANRYSWIAVGAALGVLFAVVAWFKRGDIALYKSLGSGRAQVAAIYAAQGIVILLAAYVVASSASFISPSLSDDRLTSDTMLLALRSGALAALTAAAVQSWIFLLAAFGATSTQLKER